MPGNLGGLITPDLVVGPGMPAPGQGVASGAFAEIAAAGRVRVAGANVHTSHWPGAEFAGNCTDPTPRIGRDPRPGGSAGPV